MKHRISRHCATAFTSLLYSVTLFATESVLNEDGYFAELPQVLSVTRLAQSVADTPGAITIIDREMIHRSGAREVSELLRLVPGFMVANLNGGTAITPYHVKLDESGSRLQVFVDGRSVYSSLYLGDTHRGLSDLVIEDIERIEVLRGSNSATYGANAFLGVINIITKNSADTLGTLVSVKRGDHGVADEMLRHGWGNYDASFRITASRRSDNGLLEYHPKSTFYSALPADNPSLNTVNFRADLHPSVNEDIEFHVGGSDRKVIDGDASFGNAAHPTRSYNSFLQGRYTRRLSEQESVTFLATYDAEDYQSVQFEKGFGVQAYGDSGGNSTRKHLEFSHTLAPFENTRAVWGAAWRQESARSKGLFNQNDAYVQTQTRLFGNLEWRFHPMWLMNLGGMLEHTNRVGNSFAPRLMFNFQPTEEHTFRVGVTKATRSPSLYELYGNNPVYDSVTGAQIQYKDKASGTAKEEKIYVREAGYFLQLKPANLTFDARFFEENLRGLLARRQITQGTDPNNYVNFHDVDVRGQEYQLDWRPLQSTRLWLTLTREQIKSTTQTELSYAAPRETNTLAWLQTLPLGVEMTVMHSRVGSMAWRGGGNANDRMSPYGVTNLRLGYPFRMGATRAEFAVTSQSINGNHLEYMNPSTSSPAPVVPMVPRRTFASLQLEF